MTLKDKRFSEQKQRRKDNALASVRRALRQIKPDDNILIEIPDWQRAQWLDVHWLRNPRIPTGGEGFDEANPPTEEQFNLHGSMTGRFSSKHSNVAQEPKSE